MDHRTTTILLDGKRVKLELWLVFKEGGDHGDCLIQKMNHEPIRQKEGGIIFKPIRGIVRNCRHYDGEWTLVFSKCILIGYQNTIIMS